MFSLIFIKSPKNERMIKIKIVVTSVSPANPHDGMPERNDFFLFVFIWFNLAFVNVSKKGQKCNM